MENKEGQYLQTYMSKSKGKLECFFGGIRHVIRTQRNNFEDGFVFQNCKKVNVIHPLGTVYIFKRYGYVCAGAFWFRFVYDDFVLLSN